MSGFDAARFQALRRGAYGAELRCHASLGSTQDAARDALAQGAGEGAVLLAEAQSAGRGRWGRRWQGQAGRSLLFTLILRAEAGAARPGSLPLLLGLAAAEALRALGLPGAVVKWPNDLCWRDRKLGGLLVEVHAGHWLVGLGLNVGQAPEDFDPTLEGMAASLAMAGLDVGREAVLAALLWAWESRLAAWRRDAAADWIRAYANVDALHGRDCTAKRPDGEVQGRAEGVDADGALCLRTVDGSLLYLHSAEVGLLRPSKGSEHG